MSVRTTIGRLGGFGLMAAVLAVAAASAPAHAAGPAEPAPAADSAAVVAAVPGLVRVQAVSPNNSLNKSVTVACPAGKRVYGAGGRITGGLGNVYMDDVTPSDTLLNVRVTGQENGAYAANWTVTAYAICGNPVLNLQRISFQSATNGVSPKNVVADCPAGTRLYGLGGEVTGGGGNVFMYRLVPNASLTGAAISAAENAADTSWTLTGYAICGNAPAGLARVHAQSPVNSINGKYIGVTCPAGKNLIGVGGEIAGRTGLVVLDDLTPTSLARVDTAGYENGPVATNWAVGAYGICA
jgi:hypothetical protein